MTECEYCGGVHQPDCEANLKRCGQCDECAVFESEGILLLCSEQSCEDPNCTCSGGDDCYRGCKSYPLII